MTGFNISLFVVIIILFFISNFGVKIGHKKTSKKKPSAKFDYVSDGFIGWIKSSGEKIRDKTGKLVYKFVRHGGLFLILGKRSSGKTTCMYKITQLLLKYDPDRIVGVWKPPPAVVPYLKSVGINAYEVWELSDIKYNMILLIDEGIINLNAKEALTKFGRNIEKVLALINQNRMVWFVTTQDWRIFSSFNQADAVIYKKIGSRLANRIKTDPFLKENKKIINKLDKRTGLIESDLDGFEETGFFETGVPDFYTNTLSEPYKEINLDFELNESERRAELLDEIALDLLIQGYKPMAKDPSYYFALLSLIKKQNMKHKLSATEAKEVINSMHRIIQFESGKISGSSEGEVEEVVESLSEFQNVTSEHLEMTKLFAQGRSSTSFDNYGKKRVMEIVRNSILFLLHTYWVKSKADKKGNDKERLIANYFIGVKGEYCIRSLASGGKRGNFGIAPDMIHFKRDGHIRIVQIKTRADSKFTFSAGDFEVELQIAEMLNQNPNFKGRVSAWLYFLPKKMKAEKVMQIRLKEESNEKNVYVNFDKQIVEYHIPEKQPKEQLDKTKKKTKKSTKKTKKKSTKKSTSKVKTKEKNISIPKEKKKVNIEKERDIKLPQDRKTKKKKFEFGDSSYIKEGKKKL